MALLNSEIFEDSMEPIVFEKIEDFQYLGAILTTKNDWSREIGIRVTNAVRASFMLLKFLKYKYSQKKKIN